MHEVIRDEMKKNQYQWHIVALLAAALLVLGICNCSSQDDSVNLSSTRAPHFTLQDIEGKTVRLKELRGKVVLLNFFATWCAPCIQEIPDFIQLYEKFNGNGFEIVAIGLDIEGAAALAPFAKRFHIPYPVLVGTRDVVVSYGDMKGVPTSFFIDKNGDIAESFIGVRPAHMLEKTIIELLGKRPN